MPYELVNSKALSQPVCAFVDREKYDKSAGSAGLIFLILFFSSHQKIMNGNNSGGNVLLQVESVRCRTNANGHNGILVVYDQGCTWTNGSGTHKVSYTFDRIKSQRVSPAGKSKVQLQLILYGEKPDPVTFHFVNPAGLEKQIEERETVKELLQQLLPKFKPKVSEDLAQKQKILSDNRELYALYQDLVTTGIISADEFWENHSKKKSSTHANHNHQHVGVSAGFLANVTQMDGCNGLKYNLTLDVIQSIFKTYPAVERKHLELVPHEMTDKEFWEKFFQSQYFYRDRTVTLNPKDIFNDCVKQDESDMNSQTQKETASEKLDLSRIMEEPPVSGVEDMDSGPKSNNSHAALLRRFNYHSSRVLKACLGDDAPSTSGGSNIVGSSLPQISHDTEPNSRKRKLISPDCSEFADKDSVDAAPLILGSSELYHQASGDTKGSTTSVMRANELHASDVTRWMSTVKRLRQEIQKTGSRSSTAAECSFAAKSLKDISENFCGAADVCVNDGGHSKELSEEIKNGYFAISELLRHFWCCFPTKTPDLEQKLMRMMETLRKFETQKLIPLEQKLLKESGEKEAVIHLRPMLHAAYSKYRSWEEKRASK